MPNGPPIEEPRDSAHREKLAFLCTPLSYPDHPEWVERVETHKSWVFLTEHFVYKLKKPIAYNSVDSRELETRCHFCREEVRLNQPLAGDTYLGVVNLCRDEQGRLTLSDNGPIVECLVKMRRLPAHQFMSSLISAGQVEATSIAALSKVLAKFYGSAPRESVTGTGYRAILEREIRLNDAVGEGVENELGASVQRAQLEFLDRSALLFDDRVATGRVVEGHGDLRPEHICLVDPPQIIDRLEFDPLLRIADPIDELSFLRLECERLGASEIGDDIFEGYCELTGDRPPVSLVRFYTSYRAAMWARLAIWRIRDASSARRHLWIARANEYLEIARRYLPVD